MAHIRIGCLGGLGENGKNLALVEVDSRIFVIDAGLKYPDIDMYGVDAVVCDIKYLIDHQKEIEGIILSHGHEDQIGALPYILAKINVPIYGTNFTMNLVEDLLTRHGFDIKKYKLYKINENKILKFATATVSFFNLTHSIPETVGISINTKDGSIVYVSDFSFSFNKNVRYKTSFDKITELGKKGVLVAMVESIGVNNEDRPAEDAALENEFKKILLHKGRIIVTVFSSTISRIQKIVDMSLETNRKIAILGRKNQRIVDIAINNNYLKIPQDKLLNLKYIDENNDNNDPNSVVIVTGLKDETYRMIIRMANHLDRLIHINKNDLVVNMAPAIPGTEQYAVDCLNELYEKDVNIQVLSKEILMSTHASTRDLMLLYSMLKPTYIMPIKGEYRHLYRHKEFAESLDYLKDNIIILDNYEFINIKNKMLLDTEKIMAKDHFIDGFLSGVNEEVIKEREVIAEEGIVIISMVLDINKKEIIVPAKILKKGYVCPPDNPLEDSILTGCDELANNHLHKNKFDLDILKEAIKHLVGSIIYKKTHKRPIVIADIALIKNIQKSNNNSSKNNKPKNKRKNKKIAKPNN